MRIGVDIGGTKIEAVALDARGQVLERVRVPTPHDYPATVATVAHLATELEERLQQSGTVGVGMPGTLSPRTGLVKNANTQSLNGRPLADDLSAALGREVRCANDADCFAASEALDGSAAGADVVFAAILGTGCGGGLAIAGRVHAGRGGLCGEWGHNALPWPEANEYPGPECYCGKRGCLEGWVSGPGFAADYARVAGRQLTAEQIAAEAAQGDADACAALSRYESRLARGLATVVNLLDPDVIVLGGGMSNVANLYESLPRLVPRYVFGGECDTPILQALHGDASGVRGAAALWSD